MWRQKEKLRWWQKKEISNKLSGRQKTGYNLTNMVRDHYSRHITF